MQSAGLREVVLSVMLRPRIVVGVEGWGGRRVAIQFLLHLLVRGGGHKRVLDSTELAGSDS
jgi:hypothetical protein